MDLNNTFFPFIPVYLVSLREKGVDLNAEMVMGPAPSGVSLREKGVDLNTKGTLKGATVIWSPFVRREWI